MARAVPAGIFAHPVLTISSLGLILDEFFQLLSVHNAVHDTLGLVLEPEARRQAIKYVSKILTREEENVVVVPGS